MNAKWTVIGVGKSRTWTLSTADGEALAKIYAGVRFCSYLVHDGQEALFNNTSIKLSDHQLAVKEALHARFKKLEGVFGAQTKLLVKLATQIAGTSHLTSDTRRETLDKLRAAVRAQP